MSVQIGLPAYVQFAINQTDLLAHTAQTFEAPTDGYITELQTTVQVAVTTGGTIGVSINGVAVAGLVATVANAAAVGTRNNATPTIPSVTRKFLKGDTISVTNAAFATQGAINGTIRFSPTPDHA